MAIAIITTLMFIAIALLIFGLYAGICRHISAQTARRTPLMPQGSRPA